MNPSELYKAGQLRAAVDAQVKEVKADPADMSKRLFLFELLAFAGDLDRARKQIDAIKYDKVELDAAVLTYRKILDAEQARRRLLSDGVQPTFLTPPPEHVQLRLQAVQRLRDQRPAEAAELLDKADAASPAAKGLLNGKPFTSLRDSDGLFASVLEVFAQGAYLWVPLEQVATLAMNPPKFTRDLLWVQARLEVRDGPSGEVFLPALYPGSHEHPDDQVKLGRRTDWQSQDNGPVRAVGVRVFDVGEEDVGLLEWRELQMS
jgi:type VI secretion system protein ImpE